MAQEILETRRLTHNDDFPVDLDKLIAIVEQYRSRKFDEDVVFLRTQVDGAEGLAQKLKTSFNEGLKGDDLENREELFGSNK